MGIKGRKPKPIEIKKLEGNPGKRPLNQNAPQPPISIAHQPPGHLDKIARAEWVRLADELAELDLLTSWDWATFATYCEAYSLWVRARKKLEAEGYVLEMGAKNYQAPSPWVAIMTQARRDVVRIGGLLGLNPSERSRLNVKKTSKKGKSKAAEFFGFGD